MGMFDGGKDEQALQLSRDALQSIQDVYTPDPVAMRLKLQQLQQQGLLTPELEQAIRQQSSDFNSISTDPRLKQAQLDALASLQSIGSEGGMNMQDRARLAQIQNESARAEKASRDSIMQNMASRGVGGSGFDLASQLANQQGSADRAAQAGLDVNAQAQKRALDAIAGAGQLGGQMQAQDFGQQAQRAQANDAISRFNAQNQQDVGARNAASMNTAQGKNLSEKQRISEVNANLSNQEQQYNKELAQKDYENRLRKAQTAQGSYQNTSNMLSQQGAAQSQQTGGLIQTGAMMMAASDKRAKKDVEELSPEDISAFLDELTGFKYSYKDPKKHGKGEQMGVMAQDVEKVAPEAVVSKDGVKHINYDDAKLKNAQMAALANLHSRLKKLEG